MWLIWSRPSTRTHAPGSMKFTINSARDPSLVISFGPNIYSICLIYVQEDFYSDGDVTITGEGLQILTYARHLLPLSSSGSLACHTYCHTGHPSSWSSPRTRGTYTYCRAFSSSAVTTCFNDLGLWQLRPKGRILHLNKL